MARLSSFSSWHSLALQHVLLPTVMTDLNPRTKSYEFLGPPGALAVTIGVPIMTYALYFSCNEVSGGCPPTPLSTLIPTVQQAISDTDWWKSLLDTKALAIYSSWYAFCIVAWAVLPGDWVQGSQLRNGKYQGYKINGMYICHGFSAMHIHNSFVAFSTSLLALGLATGYIMRFGVQSFTFFYEHWVGFVTAALLNSVLQGLLWYGLSFSQGKLLALGGNSGNPIYDVRPSSVSICMTLTDPPP